MQLNCVVCERDFLFDKVMGTKTRNGLPLVYLHLHILVVMINKEYMLWGYIEIMIDPMKHSNQNLLYFLLRD